MAEMRYRNPVAALLRLPPAWARLAMLALAAVLAVALYAGLRPAMLTLEERLGALGWTLYADPTEEQRITLVTIDEASLAEVGPWPWPRETLARLVTAIDESGAQLQLHDIVYSEPRPGDGVLAEALAASRGAVLAQLPVLQSREPVQTGSLTHPLAGLQCGAGLPQTDRYLAADSIFAGIPKGHIAPLVSSDGAVRKTPAAVCVEGEGYPALALSAWLTAVQAENWSATLIDGNGLLGPDQYLRLVSYPDLEIPLDSEGNLRISYASDPSAFRAIPAVDILNGEFDPAWFDNTWALVGLTAFGVGGDVVPTPYAGIAQGVELQARILASLLDGAIPWTPRCRRIAARPAERRRPRARAVPARHGPRPLVGRRPAGGRRTPAGSHAGAAHPVAARPGRLASDGCSRRFTVRWRRDRCCCSNTAGCAPYATAG